MKFSPDMCVTCGTKSRKTFDSKYAQPHYGLVRDNQGSFGPTPFWFCSDICIQNAIDSFLDKRFQNGVTAADDPRCPDHHIEEFIVKWNKECLASWLNAVEKLADRAMSEGWVIIAKWEAEEAKEAEKTRKEEQIAEEKRRKEQQREEDRLDRIERQERLDAERRERQEKLDAQRELDRQEKLRKETEREQEKQIEQQRREEQEQYEQAYEQAHLDDHLRDSRTLR
jgi:hypothetical protein